MNKKKIRVWVLETGNYISAMNVYFKQANCASIAVMESCECNT